MIRPQNPGVISKTSLLLKGFVTRTIVKLVGRQSVDCQPMGAEVHLMSCLYFAPGVRRELREA